MGRTSLRPWFMGNKMQFEAVACRLVLHYSYTLAKKARKYGIFCFQNKNRKDVSMYPQKLTLDPKLAGICEATLTTYDPEPLQQETSEKAGNFKVLGCSKLSDQEMKAHKLMRAAVPMATPLL